MTNVKPAFLVTIDVEGDNLWSSPRTVTTGNARFVPRFQDVCERHGLKPTWLTNYEMARSSIFCEFAEDVLERGTGEVGMHLHAWDSPPATDDCPRGQAYLIEYPAPVMRDKIAYLTDLLEERFGCKMHSHRAGRWAFNRVYARLLVDHGYRVDCSVTPHVSWADVPGVPRGSGGVDYTAYPADPYFMDLDRIERQGNSTLLEVPVSIVRRRGRVSWLRPQGDNLGELVAILEQALSDGRKHVEFMLHSSELMPGGSPTFPTTESIEALYDDLEAIFSVARDGYRGATLDEFYTDCVAGRVSLSCM